MSYDEMIESPVAEILAKILAWTNKEDHDLIVKEVGERFGRDAEDMVHNMIQVNEVNG